MVIRQIEPQDYKHIVTLYRRCFEIRISVKEIEKKYTGKVIGYLAMDHDRPAAFYGVFRWPLQDIKAAQSADTMTDPDYRGNRLFINLAEKTYEQARKEGIELIFGFPNINSFHGFQKYLGWKFIGYMQDFVIENKTFPLCELAGKFPILQPLYDMFTGGKQNLDFLGHKICVKPKSHLYVGEVDWFPYHEIEQFINTLVKFSVKKGCKKTIISINGEHWLYHYLSLYGLNVKPGYAIGFRLLKYMEMPKIMFDLSYSDMF